MFSWFITWGLIGGAALAFSSKNYKHYLILGLLGGIGLYLGFQVDTLLEKPNYFFSSDILSALALLHLYPIFVGGFFGLLVGTSTKRISKTLLFMLWSIIAFTMLGIIETALYDFRIRWALVQLFGIPAAKVIVYVLSAGIMGSIIGIIWSYLNSDETTLA